MEKTRTEKKWATYVAEKRIWTNGVLENNLDERILIKATKSRTTSGLKDFRTKLNAGINATTALTAFDEIIEKFEMGKIRAVHGSQVAQFAQVPSATIPSTTAISAAMVNEAKAKAYGYMNDFITRTYSEFNGQVFAGELRRTIDFLKDPLDALRRLTEQLVLALVNIKRSKTKRGAKDLAHAVSDVWLQYRFALLPLVNDIDELVSIINDVAKKTVPKRSRFFGFSESSNVAVDLNYTTGLSDVASKRELTTIHKAECFLHAGILFRHNVDDYTKQSGALKEFVEANELPSTLWELTPFSFLVDYFTNVGSIISSATQSYADVVYISESIVKTSTVIDVINGYHYTRSGPYWATTSTSPAISRIKRREVVRSARASAIPPLSVSLPGSSIQYMNMAALLAKLT